MLLLRSGAIRRELSLSPGRCLPAAMGPLVRVGTAASRAPLARRPVTLLLVPSRTVRYEDALSEKRNRRCIVAENPQREPEARPRRQHAEGRQRARPVRARGWAISPSGEQRRPPANAGQRYPAEILTPDEVRALIKAC